MGWNKVFSFAWFRPKFQSMWRSYYILTGISFIVLGMLVVRVMFEFKDKPLNVRRFLTDKLSLESWNLRDNYKPSKPTTFPPGYKRSTWTQEYRYNTCYSDWQRNYEKFHKETLASWNKNKGGRFLVYRCRASECPFGYGNRMRSLISVFYMALLTNRAFLVDWTSPSRLDKYLNTNRILWNNSLGHHNESYRLNSWAGYILKHYRPIVEKVNLTRYFDHKVEIIRGLPYALTRQLHTNPYVAENAAKFGFPLDVLSSQYKAFGCAFHFLFKLNTGTQNKLNKLTNVMGYDNNIMLSIHIRDGDGNFVKNSTDFRFRKGNFRNFFSCVYLFKKAIQTVYNTTRVSMFFATDSWHIKEVARKEYPDISQYRGSIQHIGHHKQKLLTDAKNPSGDHMETIFIEQFLMAKCDFHFHNTHSSFSEMSQGMAFGTHENTATMKTPDSKCVLPRKLKQI